MADIATRAGVSKATLYLYFQTREALFLALTEEVLGRWFDAVARTLPERCTGPALRRVLTGALESEPVLPRLLGVLHTTLEHNIDDAEVKRFKLVLKDGVTTLGARIDATTGWPAGSGAQILLRLHVCIIGSIHVGSPSAAVQRALEDDALALFRLNFRSLIDDLLPLIVHPR